MKSIKNIALSAFLTVSAFGAVLYTSCTKDECKDVVCQNGGTCSEGTCTCPTGVGGTNCETIYRTTYVNTYIGNGTDNATPANTYTGWRASFSTVGTDLTKMEIVLKDNTSAPVVTLPITLSDIKTTGSVFTITSTTANGYTYTGTGNVSATVCSITLTEKNSTETNIYTFTNMAKQ
jgi:hypothetical protein